MDKAKQTITDFMSHNNEHNTIVDQDQRAAITEEQVRPERHEEVTTVIDKEIHQDHHQTILQPIKHTERLAEKHTHNAAAVQHKTFEHDKAEDTRALVDGDIAKYRDSSVTHDTVHTSSQAPVVQGEHIHHHLHQHIQPVIQKDTIAPEVVHTTIPIHETHHAPTVSHGTTTLPAKTLEEFESEHGGLLKGSQTATVGEFDGCAKTYVQSDKGGLGALGSKSSSAAVGQSAAGDFGSRSSSSAYEQAPVGAPTTTGTQSGVKSMVDPYVNNKDSKAGLKDNNMSDYKVASQAANRAYNESSIPRNSGVGAAGAAAPGVAAPGKPPGTDLRTSASGASSKSSGKVSLKDKLNPFKDADGDGKKGIMS